MDALEKAVKVVGSQVALAAAIEVKQGHVWHWLRKSGFVPAEYVLPIYRATLGKVTPHELRPDIYPDPDWLPALNQAPNKQAVGDGLVS